ncbi:hypothetical protein Lser_V15G15763 [Lactuca serriola]
MQTPYHSNVEDTSGGSNVADLHGSHFPLIHRDGKGFADHSIHGLIVEMAWDCLDHAWPTYKSIPREVVKQWFARFMTRYRWNSQEEGGIFDCFESVLKVRFRDIMGAFKKTSSRMARKAGHTIHEINDSYQILQNFAPRPIHEDVWRRLCVYWDTDEWKKKSLIGKRNRSTSVDSGVTSTYTSSNIEVSETRKQMKKLTDKDPDWVDVFMKTRLTTESKAKYFNGDGEGLQYITSTAQQAYRRHIGEASSRSMETIRLSKELMILSCGPPHRCRGREGKAKVTYMGLDHLIFILL